MGFLWQGLVLFKIGCVRNSAWLKVRQGFVFGPKGLVKPSPLCFTACLCWQIKGLGVPFPASFYQTSGHPEKAQWLKGMGNRPLETWLVCPLVCCLFPTWGVESQTAILSGFSGPELIEPVLTSMVILQGEYDVYERRSDV